MDTSHAMYFLVVITLFFSGIFESCNNTKLHDAEGTNYTLNIFIFKHFFCFVAHFDFLISGYETNPTFDVC